MSYTWVPVQNSLFLLLDFLGLVFWQGGHSMGAELSFTPFIMPPECQANEQQELEYVPDNK